MFRKKRKKKDEYLLVIYKKDLSVDLNRILVPDKLPDVKEYIYVPHNDATEEHYHVYIKYPNSSEILYKEQIKNGTEYVGVLLLGSNFKPVWVGNRIKKSFL